MVQHTLNTFHDFISSFIISVYSFLHLNGGILNSWITYFAKVSFNNAVKADKSFTAKVRSVCFFIETSRYMPSVSHPTAKPSNQAHEQLSVQYSKARAPKPQAPPPPTRAPVTADATKARPIPAPRGPTASLKKPPPKKPVLKAPNCPPPLPPPSQRSAVSPVAQWGAPNRSHKNKVSGFHLTGMSMPLLESGRNTKVWRA